MAEDLEVVTIRLRTGDKDALSDLFHPVPYNKVIRKLISNVVDSLRQGKAANLEINDD